MKKIKYILILLGVLLSVATIAIPQIEAKAKEIENNNLIIGKNSFSCILADGNSGKIIYQKNQLEKKPIASMTKIMTLLVIYDNINNNKINLEDNVTVSKNASHMGGSQAFLDEGSIHKVKDLIKTIIVASANDSCVALAEHISGSVENFVMEMNKKAKAINLEASNFVNCTGLPALNQYSCALDCVKMFLELINQKNNYFEYSQIWLDDYKHPSGRITSLTNTNKLVKFYEGCDGGKTGYTNEAKHCLCATAKRGDTRLIACVLGEPDSKTRFAEISEMLNYGFANYANKVLLSKNTQVELTVKNAKDKIIYAEPEKDLTFFAPKNQIDDNVSIITQFDKNIAPIKKGEIIGKAYLVHNEEVIMETNLISVSDIDEKTYFDSLKEITKNW